MLRLIGLLLMLSCGPLLARTPEQQLDERIARMEQDLAGRIGIYLYDSASGWSWGHRQDERFLMASTFKSLLCGAVLAAAGQGDLSLDERLAIGDKVPANSPVTSRYLGGRLPVERLCYATLDESDNGAANLLVARLGGPQAVTAFLRSLGDEVTRLDRTEPELTWFVPGDPRDTTSPAAMVYSWSRILTGDVLSPAARRQLTGWLSTGRVTGALLRPSVPPDWQVADRSGGGREHTRNIIAMLTPPGKAPVFVAIYLSDTPASWQKRNQAVADLSAAVMAVVIARQDGAP